MSKAKSTADDTLRPEYKRSDLGVGVRGKYLAAYRGGSNRALGTVPVTARTPRAARKRRED